MGTSIYRGVRSAERMSASKACLFGAGEASHVDHHIVRCLEISSVGDEETA